MCNVNLWSIEHGIRYSEFITTWSTTDRDMLRAWKILEAERCSSCNRFSEEWVDPITRIPIDPAPEIPHEYVCEPCRQAESHLASKREQLKEHGQEAHGMTVRFAENTAENRQKYQRIDPRAFE